MKNQLTHIETTKRMKTTFDSSFFIIQLKPIFLFSFFVFHLMGCKPDEVPPTPHTEETPVIWSYRLQTSGLSSTPHYYKGSLIFGHPSSRTNEYIVYCLDGESGDSLWQTKFSTSSKFNPFNTENSLLYGNIIVFCSRIRIFALDADNGQVLWKYEDPINFKGMCLIDGYIYIADEVNRRSSTMYKFDINTGAKQALFTIKHGKDEPGGDFTPYLLMPVKWIHPSGDEILVLQNRSYGHDKIGHDGNYGYSKMDLMAYNVTADSILWYRYEVDNFSSGTRPAIDGDKVYFFGGQTVYCVHAGTGETLWEYSIGTGNGDNFFDANVLLHGDKLIAKPNNSTMHALDKNTGTLIWKNTDLVSMPSMLNVKDNVIWYAGGGIWAIDASSGSTLIKGHRGTDGSWIFPIAHHPTNGHIYTSDGWTFWCLDWKKLVK